MTECVIIGFWTFVNKKISLFLSLRLSLRGQLSYGAHDMVATKIPGYFKSRRDALMKKHPSSAFIFCGAKENYRNPDVTFPFRQESNFYYLTGLQEAEASLVLIPSSTKGDYKTILFMLPKDREKEMWTGERYGVEGALQVFGADEAYPCDEFEKKLPELLKTADQVYYRIGLDETIDRKILAALEVFRRSLGRSGKSMAPILDPNSVLGEMRLFKSPEEIEIMKSACSISAQAHKTLMKEVKPGMNEFEVEALLNYLFRKNGCQRIGYGSIVAGGKNSTCLHYTFNNEVLKDGDLLLIDAGGEVDYYSADITRTFPVGKKFSESQTKSYELVLKSQLECIAMTRPGVKLPEIHKHASEVLIDGFLSLGLLKGSRSEIFEKAIHKRFYPHNTSHWLGMDVHDVGLYSLNGEPRELKPGMVFTIEPGFYVQPNDRDVAEEYKNIGIRIEDDILVTQQGCEVLSKEAPKSISDIEALRA